MVEKNPRRKRLKRLTPGDITFNIFNYALIAILTFTCVYPFLNQFATAFSGEFAIRSGQVYLWPVDFQLDAFGHIVNDTVIFRSLLVTIFLATFGTFLNLCMTVITAYPLSRRDLRGRQYVITFVLVTMLFSGGMIPSFLLLKFLGLLNTLWAVILPGLTTAFYIFLMMTFFRNLPEEIRESATVDGCGNMRFIAQFVLPLSKAALATIGLFYAVLHWNSYMAPLIYIDNSDLWPLQVKLRNILLLSQMDTSLETMQVELDLNVNQESIKAATIVYSTLPILLVYPWLQKYFVKGVMIGSVKG
jgi:ABC-type glycerol-3-phosphate transport system permease component